PRGDRRGTPAALRRGDPGEDAPVRVLRQTTPLGPLDPHPHPVPRWDLARTEGRPENAAPSSPQTPRGGSRAGGGRRSGTLRTVAAMAGTGGRGGQQTRLHRPARCHPRLDRVGGTHDPAPTRVDPRDRALETRPIRAPDPRGRARRGP